MTTVKNLLEAISVRRDIIINTIIPLIEQVLLTQELKEAYTKETKEVDGDKIKNWDEFINENIGYITKIIIEKLK